MNTLRLRMTSRVDWKCWLLVFSLLTCVQTANADAITDYNVAVEFYNQQRWDLAADACADFLKKNPTNERANTVRLFWAQSLLHLRKFREAREQFQAFNKQAADHPDRPLALYRVGECSYFLGDYQTAETDLQLFLKSFPDHELAEWGMVYLGESQLRLKKFDLAAQTFQSAITKFPKARLLDDAEFGLAAAFEGANQSDQATEVYQKIAARTTSPRAADAQFNIAARLFDLQKYADSAVQFQKLAKVFPEHKLAAAAHLNAGYAFYYLAQYPEAMAEFQQTLNAPAHRETASYWIGLCQKSTGDYAAAAKTFAASIAAVPDQPLAEKVTFQWGDAEFRQAQYAKAVELFTKVARQWPQSDLADDAMYSASEAAMRAGDFKHALTLNEEFVKSFPTSPLLQVQELLGGRILIAQGDAAGPETENGKAAYAQAAIVLKRVIETSTVGKTRDSARFQLARAAERQGRDGDVITALSPLLSSLESKSAPEYMDAVLLSANARLRSGDAAAAFVEYEQYQGLAKTESEKLLGYTGMVSALATLKSWQQLDETLVEFEKNDPARRNFEASALEAGDAAFDQREWQAATNCFRRLLANGSQGEFALPALSGLAHSEYEQKNYQASAQAFGRLADVAKADSGVASHARYMQALALQQGGDAQGALAIYEQASKEFSQSTKTSPLDEHDAEIGRNAYRSQKAGARVARELNQTAEADKLYEAAYKELKRQPETDQADLDLLINEWADLSYNAKNFKRSDELYTLLVQERPDSPLADDALLILAESLRFSGEKEKAIAAFRKLADDPKADEFVQQRSLIHLVDLSAEAGNWNDVAETSLKMQKQFPSNAQSQYIAFRRGEGLLKLQKYSDSATALDQVRSQLSKDLARAPDWWPEAWLLLAEAYFWQKDYAKMEEVVADFRAKAPASALLYRADALLGRGLENRARFNEAREAYLRVVDSPAGRGTETAAEAQFRIAESYLKENNLPVALREYYKVYAGYEAPKYESAALFQAAACDVSMKHYADAGKTYRKLIEEFPDSEYTEKAKTQLQELEPLLPK